MSTNTVLRDLKPDTEYKVTLVPIYSDVEGKRMSENGKTSEFGQSRAAVTTSGSQRASPKLVPVCFEPGAHRLQIIRKSSLRIKILTINM